MSAIRSLPIHLHRKLSLTLTLAFTLILIYLHNKRPTHPPFRNYLVLVTAFRDESPYLLEWVSHHLLHGVDHIHLYDDRSSDRPLPILLPLIRRNLITLHNTTALMSRDARLQTLLNRKLSVQLFTRAHFHYLHRHEAVWALYLDLDEFLYPCGKQQLPDILRAKATAVGGVALPRVPFSTAARRRRIEQDELALLTYFERRCVQYLTRERGKIVYRTALQTSVPGNVHDFTGSTGKLAGTERHRDGDICAARESVVLLLHVARSLEECEEKREISERGHGGWRHRTAVDDCLKRHSMYSEFPKHMYVVDQDIRNRLWKEKNRLCAFMRELHPRYCRETLCCAAYERDDGVREFGKIRTGRLK